MIGTTLIECWPHPSVGACGASCRAVPGSRFVTTSAYLYYGAETVACAGPGLPPQCRVPAPARARPPRAPHADVHGPTRSREPAESGIRAEVSSTVPYGIADPILITGT